MRYTLLFPLFVLLLNCEKKPPLRQTKTQFNFYDQEAKHYLESNYKRLNDISTQNHEAAIKGIDSSIAVIAKNINTKDSLQFWKARLLVLRADCYKSLYTNDLEQNPENIERYAQAIWDISMANQVVQRFYTSTGKIDSLRIGIFQRLYAEILGKSITYPDSIKKAETLYKSAVKWHKCSEEHQITTRSNFAYMYVENVENSRIHNINKKQEFNWLQKANREYTALVSIHNLEQKIDIEDYFRLLNNQGYCYYFEKKYDEAIFSYKKALNIVNKLGINDAIALEYLASFYQDYALLLHAKQDNKGVINKLLQADILFDSLRVKKQINQQSKLFWRNKASDIYNTALAVCYELKDKENAYYFMEKSRAVVLQEALRKASIGNKSTSSQVLGLQQLQSKLAANQTFVSYFAGDSAIYAFRVDAKRYDFQKLDISRSRYDALSQSFLQKCSSQVLNKDFVGIAKELYDSLFAPLDIPAGQRVIISTNHTFLPFSALIDKTGKYLVHNHAFSYAFSASLLFPPTKTNKPKASYQLLAVQPHIFQNGLPTLADTNNSINEIRKIGYWGRKYFEVDATKDNLLAAMAKAKIIYFFTHATGNEQESKVYLRNEALNLEDIYAQQGKIAADLVCFAACQTALGKTESGEGVMSLARAFAYAGVPSMLSTLWNVNSGYTGSIYTYFFKNMSDDATKDIALQAAQIRFLNEPDTKNPDKTLPTNWAGLVVLGDTANIDNAMPPANTLLTIALCLVFAGFLWWRRK